MTNKYDYDKDNEVRYGVVEDVPMQDRILVYVDAWYRYGVKSKAYKEAFPEKSTVDYKFHDLPEVQLQLKKDLQDMQANDPTIMSKEEILSMYSAIARGDVADQFGLEASLDTRLAALKELGKRYGLASEVIEIKRNDGFAERMKLARERALLNGKKST